MREWSDTLYFVFADEVEAKVTLATAGITVAGTLMPRRSFCALVAPIREWQTPPAGTPDAPVDGVARAGFWTMMKLDTNWSGYAAAMAVLQPFQQTLNTPDNIFAGED